MIYTSKQLKEIITPIAEKYNLRAVYLFGSYSRGTAGEHSDVDLIVDTAGTEINSLFGLGALYNDLTEALGKDVDLLTVSSIEQPPARQSDVAFRENVIGERMKLYAVA